MKLSNVLSGFAIWRVGQTVRKRILLLFITPILLAALSCSKDDSVLPTPKPVVVEDEPRQYDVPFANVPATERIVMYEVNLWAFSQEGNLEGVKARLDHLKSLGVNVLWLMPIYEIGELKAIGSPYAIKNYKRINPAFGTLEDLRSLVKEAHARNMAVMLDWVANHTAWDNEWIKNTSWYTRDGSGNIISPEGMGWNDVADLNFGSSAMRKEMIKAMKYWVLEANIDGFRCDYAEGVPTEFWKQAIDTLRKIPSRELVMFAEGGKKELFSAGFDLIFGWNFYGKLKDVYENSASANNVVLANTADYTNVPVGRHILRWISNHDDNAWDDTPVNVFRGQEGALAAFVVTAYMGGVPLLYNGQEVGFNLKLPFLQNSSVKIDWTQNPEVLEQYQKLMAFRQNSPAVTGGSLETFHTADVIAFKKKLNEHEVVVVVNLRNISSEFVLPAALINSNWTDAMTNESTTLADNISLEPYQYRIFRK